jgi:2-oxoglutarate ferredoxin oxidoreductase subunit beta
MSAKEDQLVDLLKSGIQNPGFSLINVLQPCVTWDKVHTYQYYQERCYELGSGYDPKNRAQAVELVCEASDKIPLGVIYQSERPAYDRLVLGGLPHPLRDQSPDPQSAVRLMSRFT